MLRFAIATTLLFIAGALHAAGDIRVNVVAVGDVKDIQSELFVLMAEAGIYISASTANNSTAIANADINLIVGSEALEQYIVQRHTKPAVTMYVSSVTFNRIIQAQSGKPTSHIAALYSDPPPLLQVALAKLFYKRKLNIGVLVSDDSAFLADIFSDAEGMLDGVSATPIHVQSQKDIRSALRDLVKFDALIAVADSTIYNKETAGYLLLWSYENNIPFFGYSAGVVKAGATGAAYIDIEDTMLAVIDMLKEVHVHGNGSDSRRFSKKVKAVINRGVAKTLDLHLNIKGEGSDADVANYLNDLEFTHDK